MGAPIKLFSFLGCIAAVFAGAMAVGAMLPDAIDEDAAASGHGSEHGPANSSGPAGPTSNEQITGGLMVSERGYTLALAEDELSPGEAKVRFSVVGPDGAPVTRYVRAHGKDLHLIAVKRDMTGFQHVHPTLDDNGVWSVPLTLDPGQWRVFADFLPAGEEDGLVLGADLTVPGEQDAKPLPAPQGTAHVGGYDVRLDGELQAGQDAELTLTVTRAGKPVTDLQPYLGSYGHLVALRDGDLAYLHVHPAGEPDDGTTEPGPAITFYASVPSDGAYRLFLDFKHAGKVRTAEFTLHAGGDQSTQAGEEHDGDEDSGHGH